MPKPKCACSAAPTWPGIYGRAWENAIEAGGLPFQQLCDDRFLPPKKKELADAHPLQVVFLVLMLHVVTENPRVLSPDKPAAENPHTHAPDIRQAQQFKRAAN